MPILCCSVLSFFIDLLLLCVTFLSRAGQGSVSISIPTGSTFLKLNAGQFGYYRSFYSVPQWLLLAQGLLNAGPMSGLNAFMSPADRAGLLSDVLYWARSPSGNYTVALELTRFLANERDYTVWSTALTGFDYLRQHVWDMPVFGLLSEWVLNLLQPVLNDLGPLAALSVGASANMTHMGWLLRTAILNAAYTFGNSVVTQNGVDLFRAFYNDMKTSSANASYWNSVIPSDIRPVVFRIGVAEGGLQQWDFLAKYYLRPIVGPAEAVMVLNALAESKQEWLLLRYLLQAMDSRKFRSQVRRADLLLLLFVGCVSSNKRFLQDFTTIIRGVGRNPLGRLLMEPFLESHWDNYLASGPYSLSSTVSAWTSQLDDEAVVCFFFCFFFACFRRLRLQMVRSLGLIGLFNDRVFNRSRSSSPVMRWARPPAL